MGGGAPRSSCLGGEASFLSGAQPIPRVASSASDSEQHLAHARTTPLYLKTRFRRSPPCHVIAGVAPFRRHRALAAWSQLAPPEWTLSHRH